MLGIPLIVKGFVNPFDNSPSASDATAIEVAIDFSVIIPFHAVALSIPKLYPNAESLKYTR
jgi:hypothetical protein